MLLSKLVDCTHSKEVHIEVDLPKTVGLHDYLNSTYSAKSLSSKSVASFIPYFPNHPYLDASIQSLEEQSRKVDEINVVFDGTGEFQPKRNERVNVFTQALNSGPFSAIGRRIIQSDCDFILFQDSDDLSHPDRLKALLNALEDFDLDCVGSNCVNFADDVVHSVSMFPEFPKKTLQRRYGYTMLYPTTLIKRRKFLEIGGFSKKWRFGVDSEFMLRAISKLKTMNLSQALYAKRFRDNSLTQSQLTGFGTDVRKKIDDWTIERHSSLFDCS